MNPPVVSVIIPVYNVELYLARCLDSVIQNTYRHLEIICVNDGSTDNCPRILQQYAQKDSRIRVISKANGGLSSARNVGMDAASGDFIAFVDSDDWIHPQYFEILLHAQQLSGADITIGNYQKTTQSAIFSYTTYNPAEISPRRLLAENYLSKDRIARTYVWGRLYRASTIQRLRFIEGLLYEDMPFNLQVYSEHEHLQIVLIPQILYFYYMRPTSLVHTHNHIQMLDICEHYLRFLRETTSERRIYIFADQCIKKALAARYTAYVLREKPAILRSNQILRKAIIPYLHLKNVQLKKKLQSLLLFAFPTLYRLFRILNDPTLLNWEKQQRAALQIKQ